MGEVLVVNLFLWVRVFLVGGIFIMFPRITRKGLLFGVYVGEEASEAGAAREVLRSWDRGCLMVMATALLVGLIGSAAGSAVAGNFTGTAVLLLGCTGLYLRSYSKVKALALPNVEGQAGRATATLQVGTPKGETFAKVTLVICLVTALASIVYALLSYPGMAARIPTLWSLVGGEDALTDKSYLTVLYVPSWNLVMGPVYALLALMIATAKRSLREGPGGRSVEAQDAFRALTARLFSGMALLICAILTLCSVQVIRIWLSHAPSLVPAILLTMGLLIVSMAAGLFWIIRHHGQGGALLERASAEGALTGGLADNARWVWGVFYVDRDDPSLMVESRFGIGYNMNWGRPTSVLFTIAALSLILTLAVLGFFV
jgi:uncharacterized membrane protein